MAINRRVLLNWDGQDYDVKITMGLIDELEQEINLMAMIVRVSESNVRYAEAARLISILLNSAGCKVSPDDVFDGMFDGSNVSAAEVVSLLIDVFSVIFPQPKKKSAKSRRKKKPQKTTLGTSSTK